MTDVPQFAKTPLFPPQVGSTRKAEGLQFGCWMYSVAKEQPGVSDCRVDIVEEISQSFEWLRELLHRRLDETPNSERKEGIPATGRRS